MGQSGPVNARPGPSRSKFGVTLGEAGRAARTYNERVYRSIKEASYARALDLQKQAGLVRDWQYEKRLPLIVDGVRVGTFVPDFWVELADGSTEIHETKGYQTPEWKFRRRVFEACWLAHHAEVTYRIL